MRITILNGNPDPGSAAFESYLDRLTAVLSPGHEVTRLDLRSLDIKYCNGCFGCWVKQPGECLVPDDSRDVRRAVIHADFVLLASPLRMGFASAVLKKMMDKFIPLIHPYFEVDHGEAHHRGRYDAYPRLGLLLEQEPGGDDEDVAITTAAMQRMALNFKSALDWTRLVGDPVEQVAQAILAPAPPRTLPPALAPLPGQPGAAPRTLTVFNGSPRGKGSNTRLMLEQLVHGFESVTGNRHELLYLNHPAEAERFTAAFAAAEAVVLAFPLYTDAMPGLVKAFIETLEPRSGRPDNPALGFMVQSGFPEAAHSRYVERYLRKLAARLGCRYLGTVVKGGCEGVHVMPEQMNRKLFVALQEIGRSLAQGGCFDPLLLRRLARPEHYPRWSTPLFKLFTRMKLATFYWDGQLRENGVYEQRFARPYDSGL